MMTWKDEVEDFALKMVLFGTLYGTGIMSAKGVSSWITIPLIVIGATWMSFWYRRK